MFLLIIVPLSIFLLLLFLLFFWSPCKLKSWNRCCSSSMTTIKILGAVAGSIVFAYVCDTLISEKKIFGGQLHYTISGAGLFPIWHSELTAAFVSNQVRLQKQLPTRNGGRQLIKSSRPGLVLLDRPSSWTQLAGKTSSLNHLIREANGSHATSPVLMIMEDIPALCSLKWCWTLGMKFVFKFPWLMFTFNTTWIAGDVLWL